MKQFQFFIILLLFLCSLSIQLYSVDNSIKNSSFELFKGEFISDWAPDSWVKNPADVAFYVEHDHPHSGNTYATIENSVAADSVIKQEVKVEPDTIYKLSCWIKATGINQDFIGANISVLNTPATSQDYKNTSNTWQYAELYGKTGPTQTQMTVAVRLGSYDYLSSGKASFDDFQMVKIANPPGNARIFDFNGETRDTSVPLQPPKAPPTPTLPLLLIFSLLFAILFFVGYHYVIKRNTISQSYDKNLEIGFAIILLLAFFLRLILAPVIEGYPYDMSCFKNWSVLAFDNGLPNFYTAEKLANYPPGYIYILYLIGLIQKLFALPTNSTIFLILLKTPSFITDIIAAFLIYRISRKYTKSVSVSACLSLLYACNPVIIHNSAIFGQVDSFFTLFILLCLVFVERKNIVIAAVFYTIAVLIKPQTLIFGPIVLAVLLETKDWRTILTSILAMIGTFIILILPFSINQSNPFWIIELYFKTLSSYDYATVNAFNLYALLGANMAALSQKFLFFSFKDWGQIFLVLILGFSIFIYIRNFQKQKKESWPFFLALFLITAFFVLVHMMHERYLYPAVLLSLLCYITINDKRFLFVFLGLSITLLFNQELILYLAYNFDLTMITADHPLEYNLMRIIGAINLGFVVYLIKIGCDVYLSGRTIPVSSKPNPANESEHPRKDIA